MKKCFVQNQGSKGTEQSLQLKSKYSFRPIATLSAQGNAQSLIISIITVKILVYLLHKNAGLLQVETVQQWKRYSIKRKK